MKNNTQPALKERIEKALDDFTKGRASMHVPPLDSDVDMVLAECSNRLSELEARCAALAAENAGLKEEISNITFMRDDDFFGSTQRAQEVMGRLVNFKTPDTDAFLAEVRAGATPDEATERELFEGWVMENYCISKTTLEVLRTCDGYRNSTLSGKDYNGMWLQWKAIRATKLRKGVQA